MDRIGNRVAIDPWQVYVTVQCYEARARQLGGEILASSKGDRAVLAPPGRVTEHLPRHSFHSLGAAIVRPAMHSPNHAWFREKSSASCIDAPGRNSAVSATDPRPECALTRSMIASRRSGVAISDPLAYEP